MQLTQLHPVPSDRAAFVRDGMDGGGRREDLHFIANAYSGDLEFELPQLGEYEWFRLADTAQASPLDIAEEGQEFPLLSQESYLVKGRSVAIFVSK